MGDSLRARAKNPGLVQFPTYVVFSGLAAALNLAVGTGLYSWLGARSTARYAACVSVGYLAGMVLNFSLNRTFTFERDGRSALLQLRSFVLVSGFGLVLNTVLAIALRRLATTLLAGASVADTDTLHIAASSGPHAAAIGIVAIYSFIAHKYLTFAGGIRAGLLRFLVVTPSPRREPKP
jgi:putative flippase GtrA